MNKKMIILFIFNINMHDLSLDENYYKIFLTHEGCYVSYFNYSRFFRVQIPVFAKMHNHEYIRSIFKIII
jgi:hypothetical protein